MRTSFTAALVALAVLLPQCAGAALYGSAPPITRLIVKFRDDATKALVSPAARSASLGVRAGTVLAHIRPMAEGAHLVALDAPLSVAGAEELAARLAQDPDVLFAEPDRMRQPLLVPNDRFANTLGYLADGPASINAFAAWDITTGSADTVIAVLDTGYRPHADLSGRILPGYDFISDPLISNDATGRDPDATDPGDWVDQSNTQLLDQGCPISESSWHGTATAGLIGANGNNGIWTAGVNWSARILPVRVLGKCYGNDSDIIDAMAWAGGLNVPGVPANPTPAQVINMSLGGESRCGRSYTDVIKAILAHGVTRAIVVAAGNSNLDVRDFTPAGCPGVISVAATNVRGQKASYSNLGAGVTISAPGGDSGIEASEYIFVLSNAGPNFPGADAGAYGAGTSFSAPLVAGVASLVLAVTPDITAAEMHAILAASAKPFPEGSNCTTAICGAGIVDAYAAIRAAMAATLRVPTVDVIEYYNPALEHYFMTSLAAEIGAYDSGAAFPGWFRTGSSLKAFVRQDPGTEPVCRILTPPEHGDSHFYSADRAECAGIMSSSLPGSANFDPDHYRDLLVSSAFFYIALPNTATGICPPATIPVYRLFNGRSDANYRYTSDPDVRDRMIDAGYAVQGYGPDAPAPAMCAAQ